MEGSHRRTSVPEVEGADTSPLEDRLSLARARVTDAESRLAQLHQQLAVLRRRTGANLGEVVTDPDVLDGFMSKHPKVTRDSEPPLPWDNWY